MPEDATPAHENEAAAPSRIDDAVDGWLADNFRNSILARDGEAWNQLVAALPDLKRRLASER
jgi:hypothetical protein